MKFKYFLRGLGVGIFFASIIFLAVYQGSTPKKMTDAEVIKKAKELGMVEEEDHLKDLLATEKTSSEDTVSQEKTTDENTTEAMTDGNTEADDAKTEEEKTTEMKTTEQASTEQSETVTVTVERGSSSYPVCQKLQELGVIDNAEEFDTYLVENGYASRIRVGTHTLKKGMDFREIAEAISDPL